MRHLGWAALLLITLVGCQGNPPRFDPFLGPATVPPPSTGGATLLPPGDPYAPQAAPAISPQGVPFVPQNSAPTVAPPFTPQATAPGPGMPYAPPPGGFQYRQSSLAPPAAEGQMVPIAATAEPATIQQAAYQAELPAAVDAEPALSAPVVGETATPSPAVERYAHDASYQHLRGQLDYSAIDKSWRLRYISLSGESDEYGGSVRLRENAALADRKPGEFVEVTGQVDGNAEDDGFAPWYRVTSVTPLPAGG